MTRLQCGVNLVDAYGQEKESVLRSRTAFLPLALALAPACTGEISQGPVPGDPPPLMGSGPGAGSGGQSGGFNPTGVNPVGGGGPLDPVNPSPRASEPTFTCGANPTLSTEPLRRLTTAQYQNTLRDLLGMALGNPATGRTVLGAPAVSAALATLPVDARKKLPQDLHGSFRRLDQDVEQSHVDNFYAVAQAVGSAVSTTQLPALLGACGTDADRGNDEACVRSFIERFGALALRRPLSPEDVTFYLGYYGGNFANGIDPAGIADVVGGLLLAPGFLYLVEHGGAAVPGQANANLVSLSAFELASRLSYHFWQTMPDAPLMDAARSGALLSEAGYKANVERMFADPRTRETIDQFYLEALKLEDVPALGQSSGDPVYRTFAGAEMPDAGLRQGMIDEVIALFRHHTWTQPGGLDAVLNSELMLAKHPGLARIYGMKPWTEGAPPESFPAGQRPGLFTRAAFLVNGSTNTRPIMKGVFLRTTMMCDEIPPPPANANVAPPPLDPMLSTRQVVEKLTEGAGGACAACHANLINPLGFLTEGFDALGRIRSEERLFDASGKEVGRVPVNTESTPQIVPGDRTVAKSPADLARLIGQSGKAHACLTRQYFRFAFGRWENLDEDGCTLEGMRKALVEGGGSLPAMFKAAAFSAQFRQRRFQ